MTTLETIESKEKNIDEIFKAIRQVENAFYTLQNADIRDKENIKLSENAREKLAQARAILLSQTDEMKFQVYKIKNENLTGRMEQ